MPTLYAQPHYAHMCPCACTCMCASMLTCAHEHVHAHAHDMYVYVCTYTRMRLRHGRELLLEVLGLPAHVAQARLGALAWCICSATCTIRASIGRAARSARTRRHVAVHLPCTHATCTCMSVPARLPRAPPHLSAASVASLARAQTSETRLGRERRRLGDPPVAQAVQ